MATATQQSLFKGELMEELVRNYFLGMGYFVVRGVKLKYENNLLSDIDLFLYGRSSTVLRERINVDIKNKKTPQAFERIVWANGIMKILGFDACIVATTDNRKVVHAFAQRHATTVLDGSFLRKLKLKDDLDRISEDELLSELSKHKSYHRYTNKNWANIYDDLKSRLLNELDYSGFHSSVENLSYFIDKSLSDVQKRKTALRMTYITTSYLLIAMDFILKDIAFLEQADREKILSDGLRFGNLGREGADKIISMALRISGGTSASAITKSFEEIPIEILRDYFIRNENANKLFGWAKEFEVLGYSKNPPDPYKLELSLRGTISVFLDYLGVERKRYFDTLISE